MSEKVSFQPSKSFFVSTLTRDIHLKDTILDLLDNCVDGVLRTIQKRPPENSTKPYEGYWAKITLSPTSFIIEDNCGGIPKEIAIHFAFRLGRVDTNRDESIPTVGMYGIGMKRALFKIGQHSQVHSQHGDESYSVNISPSWLEDDHDWHLPLNPSNNKFDFEGTRIEINELYTNISRQFADQDFVNELHEAIKNFFALIIDKGFSVYLNDKQVTPTDFRLFFAPDFSANQVQPYVYQAIINNVSVDIVVGLYRELASVIEIEEELAEEMNLPTRKSGNAGWTIICNDRVILYKDKSRITGWGVRDVPQYHTQYISIAGTVVFSSNDSLKLPLNTTKTSLDTSSEIYGHVLNRMMEGLKKFTNFTSRWKGREGEVSTSFTNTRLSTISEIIGNIPSDKWIPIRGSQGNEKRFEPNLPEPPKERTKRRISFYKPTSDITELSIFLFDDSNVSPSEIGEKCFDEKLKEARGKYDGR